MKWKMVMLLLLLGVSSAVLWTGRAKAQQGNPSRPVQGAANLNQVERRIMPSVDVAALLREDEQNAALGNPPRFAAPLPIELNPENSGTWELLSGNRSLWRLRIAAPGALSLNFGWKRYHMPPSGRLLLYTPDEQSIRGPFTAADNAAHGELWSPILNGAEVVIEVVLNTDERAQLELQLTSVNHGYKPFGSSLDKSGSCNVDVICSQGDGWRDQIRSVAVYSTGGSRFCTGFLVNNVAQDGKPYFMTANHCGINSGNAASIVTYWNYQNSTCRTPGSSQSGQAGDGSLAQFVTGAYFRSASSTSDFTLIEMDEAIPAAYNVYWAGWDNTSANPSSAVTIHHPNADEKRISFENDPLSTTSYGSTATPGNGSHLRITDWDLGTTEPGSSGSPLFNPAKRIVGQLHGGFAACGNDDSDWYGRFSVSWTGGGTAATRLKDWLDPNNTGATALDGRNASSACTITLSPTSRNFTAAAAPSSFTVNDTSNAGWVAVSLSSFITITAPGSGTGAGTVNFTITANNSTTSRTGAITVGCRTFTVRQGAMFNDVPATHPFYDFIGKLSAAGITAGCGNGNFCPDANVTREQMAIFIERSLGVFSPTEPATASFADVPNSGATDYSFGFIEDLYARGITAGCTTGPLRYCPFSNVARDQMAVFVLRGVEGGNYVPPPATGTVFADVPASLPFAAWIEELARRGITSGCGGGNYCPTANVTRGQMAVFLVRAFNL